MLVPSYKMWLSTTIVRDEVSYISEVNDIGQGYSYINSNAFWDIK